MNAVQRLKHALMKALGCDETTLQKKIDRLDEDVRSAEALAKKRRKEREEWKKRKQRCEDKVSKLQDTIDELRSEPEVSRERFDFITEKRTFYHRTGNLGEVDVHKYIKIEDPAKWKRRVKKLLGNRVKQDTATKVIGAVLEEYANHRDWHYIRDRDDEDMPEHFQGQDTSWNEHRGDCEDKGSMMHKLMVAALLLNEYDEHVWRLFFFLGGVITGGHAYQGWYTPEGVVPVESTYHQQRSYQSAWKNKSPIHAQSMYTEIWGAANQEAGYADMTMRRLEELA
jgi:hypothetical protein